MTSTDYLIMVIPYGTYECPYCGSHFAFTGGSGKVICPKCKADVTVRAIHATDPKLSERNIAFTKALDNLDAIGVKLDALDRLVAARAKATFWEESSRTGSAGTFKFDTIAELSEFKKAFQAVLDLNAPKPDTSAIGEASRKNLGKLPMCTILDIAENLTRQFVVTLDTFRTCRGVDTLGFDEWAQLTRISPGNLLDYCLNRIREYVTGKSP